MAVTPPSPHPIDVHVGSRIRLRRRQRDMSQTTLAEHLNLTFQQIQKYEKGSNRVSSSKLWSLAAILDVPVAWFFEDYDSASAYGIDPPTTLSFDALARQREASRLIKAFCRIEDRATRNSVIALCRAVRGAEQPFQ